MAADDDDPIIPEAPRFGEEIPEAPVFGEPPPAPTEGPPGPPSLGGGTRAAAQPKSSKTQLREKAKEDYVATLRGMTKESLEGEPQRIVGKTVISKKIGEVEKRAKEYQVASEKLAKIKKDKDRLEEERDEGFPVKLAGLEEELTTIQMQKAAVANKPAELNFVTERETQVKQRRTEVLQEQEANANKLAETVYSETSIKALEAELETLKMYKDESERVLRELKQSAPKIETPKTVDPSSMKEAKEGGKTIEQEYAQMEHYGYLPDGSFDPGRLITLQMKCATWSGETVTKRAEIENVLQKGINTGGKNGITVQTLEEWGFGNLKQAREQRKKENASKIDTLGTLTNYEYDQYGKPSTEPLKKLQAFFKTILGLEFSGSVLKQGLQSGRIAPAMINAIVGSGFDIEQSIKNKEELKKVAKGNKEVKGADNLDNYQCDMEGNTTSVPQDALRNYFKSRTDLQTPAGWFKAEEVDKDLAKVLKRSLDNGIVSIKDINATLSQATGKPFDIKESIHLQEERRLKREEAAREEARKREEAAQEEARKLEEAEREKAQEEERARQTALDAILSKLSPEEQEKLKQAFSGGSEKLKQENERLKSENEGLKQQKTTAQAKPPVEPSVEPVKRVSRSAPEVSASPQNEPRGKSLSINKQTPSAKNESGSARAAEYSQGVPQQTVGVLQIMEELVRKNNDYLKSYQDKTWWGGTVRKEKESLFLKARRLTADTKAIKKKAVERGEKLDEFIKRWKESEQEQDVGRRVDLQNGLREEVKKIITADLEANTALHGRLSSKGEISKILTQFLEKLQNEPAIPRAEANKPH